MLSFSETEGLLDVTCFSYSLVGFFLFLFFFLNYAPVTCSVISMKWYYLCPEGKLKTWTDYVFTHFYYSCGSNTL